MGVEGREEGEENRRADEIGPTDRTQQAVRVMWQAPLQYIHTLMMRRKLSSHWKPAWSSPSLPPLVGSKLALSKVSSFLVPNKLKNCE